MSQEKVLANFSCSMRSKVLILKTQRTRDWGWETSNTKPRHTKVTRATTELPVPDTRELHSIPVETHCFCVQDPSLLVP